MMKKLGIVIAAAAIAASTMGALVIDEDFDGGFSGWNQNGSFSAKADAGVGDSVGVNWATN